MAKQKSELNNMKMEIFKKAGVDPETAQQRIDNTIPMSTGKLGAKPDTGVSVRMLKEHLDKSKKSQSKVQRSKK